MCVLHRHVQGIGLSKALLCQVYCTSASLRCPESYARTPFLCIFKTYAVKRLNQMANDLDSPEETFKALRDERRECHQFLLVDPITKDKNKEVP